MSHFLTFVVVPSRLAGAPESRLDDAIRPLLAPFNENIEVEPYRKKCSCIGRAARHEVAIELGLGDRMSAAREAFNAAEPDYFKLDPDARERQDEKWRATIAPILKLEQEALLAHPLIEKPNPECGDCRGTGSRESTYNPKAKWDWFVIGGRWQGVLVGADIEKNPANYEPCWVCGATGRRDDVVGREARAQRPDYTCNGCSGKGRMLKASSGWVKEQNAMLVRDLLALSDGDFDKRGSAYAVVTPDGEWHQRGEMGWFGMASNEQPRADWRRQLRELLQRHETEAVVAVDCHI